jgi:3-phenylpropionate/cinnamic acid dioxygenase small subunit
MTTNGVLREMSDRLAILDLVHKTASLLDEEDLDGWLKLFDGESVYELCAYSTEIRRWMSWWKSDRETLAKELRDVCQHVRDPASRRHIVGAPMITFNGDQAQVISPFVIFRTTPDGHSSQYMVGRYDDALVRKSQTWLYKAHKVIADTRVLDSFTHLPV